MSFREVADLDCETTTALGGVNKQTGKPNPTKVEGYFIGSKDTPSKKSRNGIAKLHIIQTAKGNVGVWGKTDLDRKMLQVAPGVMTRVTLLPDRVPTPNGPMYKFKVETDPDNSIEVSFNKVESDDTFANAEEDAVSDGTAAYEEEPVEEEEEEAYTPPPAAKPPVRAAKPASAEQQAKVRALLGGKK